MQIPNWPTVWVVRSSSVLARTTQWRVATFQQCNVQQPFPNVYSPVETVMQWKSFPYSFYIHIIKHYPMFLDGVPEIRDIVLAIETNHSPQFVVVVLYHVIEHFLQGDAS